MSSAFAVGKYALGICDRCGRQYGLGELSDQIVNRIKTGLLVCEDCNDEDHPQLQLGKTPVFDPQALRSPSPDDRSYLTNHPVFNGEFTFSGAPIFTTNITPAVCSLQATGRAGTARRG